jgi:hypothetical protein
MQFDAPFYGLEHLFGHRVNLRTAHGTFIRSHPGERSKVDTEKIPQQWEQFTIEPHGQGEIVFRSVAHGTFLRADGPGEGRDVNTAGSPGEWEEWRVVFHPQNRSYSVRSAHGNHLRAHAGDDSKVDLAERIGDWEHFWIAPAGGALQFVNRPIRLRTAHGTWLRAAPGEFAMVDVQSRQPGEWERFVLEQRPNGTFAIRTHHGSHLRADGGGEGAKVNTQTDQVKEWEEWRVEFNTATQHYNLKSHHNTFLRAHRGDEGARVDQSAQAGEWEQFAIVLA